MSSKNMSDNARPFDPPHSTDIYQEKPVRRTRWRLIPTMFLGVLGTIMTVIGLFFLVMILRIVFDSFSDPDLMDYSFNDARRRNFLVLTPVLQLGWGISWILASFGCWRCRWKFAAVCAIAGILCMVLYQNVEIPT